MAARYTTYPDNRNPTSTLSFKVHSSDDNVIFNSIQDNPKLQFDQQMRLSSDFGLSFVNFQSNNGKSSFHIMFHLYNIDQPDTQVQDNKGNFVGTLPIQTYKLILEDILDGDQMMLLIRLLGDIVKDLTKPKIRLSVNGAKETLRKFMKDIFNPQMLNQTLDNLLSVFENELTPSPGEMTIQGVLSRPKHTFGIPEEERVSCPIMWSRDCGPAPDEIHPDVSNIPIRDINHIKNKLTGFDHVKQLQYTAGNKIDPATNSTITAFYSPLFINYYPDFLSNFNGVDPRRLAFGLFTRRVPGKHNAFLLDVEIIKQQGILNAPVIAEFNNIFCDMTRGDSFASVDGRTYHRYTKLAELNPQPQSREGTTPYEFKKAISGNNQKNAFFLRFMNKIITDTKEAEGLAKIILKSGGDPNQILIIIAEILYYSLHIYRDQLSHPVANQKSLKQIFQETFKKYLLVTCDGVLASLARRLYLTHVHQIGNSANYVKYGTTSDEEKALSTFSSLKEKLKKDLENYMKLLSRWKIGTLYIVFDDDAIFPVTSKTGRPQFCDVDENIKLLKIAIQKHFTTIEDLQPLPVTSLNIAELRRISQLYKVSIITKTTKITPEHEKLTIYHLNYLQSLSLLLSLGINMEGFVFCTKITSSRDTAFHHPYYVRCITAYKQAAAEAEAQLPPSSSSPPQKPPQEPPSQSLFERSVCNIDQNICQFLTGTTGQAVAGAVAVARARAGVSPSVSVSASQSISQSMKISSKPEKIKQELLATKINDQIKTLRRSTRVPSASCSLARSNMVEINSRLIRATRHQGGGGKSNNVNFQKGGCERPILNFDYVFDYVFENLFGLLGDKAICEWIERPTQREDDKIYINCDSIIEDNDGNTSHSGGPDKKILSVKLPDLQYCTLALLSHDVFNQTFDNFKRFIMDRGSNDLTLITLYDIVQDFILTLKRNDREDDMIHKADAAEAAAKGAALIQKLRFRQAAAEAEAAADAMGDLAVATAARQAVAAVVAATEAATEAAAEAAAVVNGNPVVMEVNREAAALAAAEAAAVATAEESARAAATAEESMRAEVAAEATAREVAATEATEREVAATEATEREVAAAEATARAATEAAAAVIMSIHRNQHRNQDTNIRIETLFQSILADTRYHAILLYSLCELFNSVDNNEDDLDDILVAEPISKSRERVEAVVETGGGGGGGGGGAPESCIRTYENELSLERAGEVFSCLCSAGRRFEAAELPVAVTSSYTLPSILLALVDLENITTVRDSECVIKLRKNIPEIIKQACHRIRIAAEDAAKTEVQAKEQAAAARAAAAAPRAAVAQMAATARQTLNERVDAATMAVQAENKKLLELTQKYERNNSSQDKALMEDAMLSLRRAEEYETKQRKLLNAVTMARMMPKGAAVKAAEAAAAAVKAAEAAAAAAEAAAAASRYTLDLTKHLKNVVTALHELPLEFHTESTEYVEWLCLCNEELIGFMYEVNLDLKSLDTSKYRYISAKVVEKCEGSVSQGEPGGSLAKSSKSTTPERPPPLPDSRFSAYSQYSQYSVPSVSPPQQQQQPAAAALGGKVPDSPPLSVQANSIPEDQIEEDNSSGGRRRATYKKSTHRKPRRHTRNYQSHNKKPKRSSRSTKYNTIKHRKSYRKHNRTIKRRGNRK